MNIKRHKKTRGGEIQKKQGKLAYYAAVGKVVEVVAKHGNIVTFIVIQDDKARLARCYNDDLQYLT